MTGKTGKWVRTPSGALISLDKIESILVQLGGNGYEVRAYPPGDERIGYYVLFSHRDRAVCEEWRDTFAQEHLDVLPPVVLMRDCPQCSGHGTRPIDPGGTDETQRLTGKRGVSMSDKPKPLHEQLMELAGWLEHEARLWNTNGFEREALIYHLKAAKVRTLAEQAKELEEAAAHAPSS